MSFDRTMARCSFCGRRPPEVRRMVAGPGAAYICDVCLEECNDILREETLFSAKALEMASRPPVVIATPQTPPAEWEQGKSAISPEPVRIINVELEQKQQGMTLLLHQLLFYPQHFELLYLWIRQPFRAGFAFVPRILFYMKDNLGTVWSGDRGGMLLARPELASHPEQAVYQGNVRFRPLPPAEARQLIIQAADPLAQFNEPAPGLWRFEITL